jgi:hypothetical protein
MEKNFALFIDTVSIQQYIFSSNKLKENIGASYIVEELLFQFNDEVIGSGYVGGGNALLFFENNESRRDFRQQYSRKVLAAFPGIRIAFSEEDNFSEAGEEFIKSKNKLVKSLIKNKSLQHLEIMPFKHGIADDCSFSNEGQEVLDNDSKQYISHQSALKIKAAELSKNSVNDKYKHILSDKYAFTNELDKLGQTDEKGYIAIVHADGNGIGEQFRNCESLKQLQSLSGEVKRIADGVLKELVSHLVNVVIKNIPEENGFDFKKDEAGKQILPFRQILAGGDDITFVCEGKLGVYLAKKLLELMSAPPETPDLPQKKRMKVDACAGIAIVHTKFPFYKAYELAVALCDRAKAESRNKEGGNANRLAFLISASGVSGSLDSIIEQNYSTLSGNMFYGSYSLGKEKPLSDLIKGVAYLQDTNKISKNKVLAMRDILKEDGTQQEYFLEELKAAAKTSIDMPEEILPNNLKKLWINGETPLYDMIDLMEFYPQFLQTLQQPANATI